MLKMENNIMTGNAKMDYVLVCFAWIFAAISWQAIPVILSSIASALVIVNQYLIYKKTKK